MVSSLKLMQANAKKRKTSYFREVQNELKKVTWVSKNELASFTKIVLGSIFVFGFFIYFADLCIRGALNLINILSRLIIG